MPLVSVIVLNWNGKEILKGCLDSLERQTFRDFETILVDNGSTDGSGVFVRGKYPWTKIVELKKNVGFAGGNNAALDMVYGDYILILSNDTSLEPDFLEEIIKPALNDTAVGMVAPKMLNFYRKGIIDSVGISVAPTGLAHNIGYGETDGGQYDNPEYLFGPSGGAALYRKAMIGKTGFFDPDFHVYYEDVDLAWRCRLAGWKCMTAPKAVVYHMHSVTYGHNSPVKLYHIHRNKWYVIFKNWPLPIILIYLPILIMTDMLSIVYAVYAGMGKEAARARIDLIRSFRLITKKRKDVRLIKQVNLAYTKKLFFCTSIWDLAKKKVINLGFFWI